jgi:hypothetical protein
MSNGKIIGLKSTSYSDSPIVNTFSNIQGKSWTDWQSDKTATNFITQDDNGNIGGTFYDNLDVIAPSSYYYYDYPHQFAGEYLSYLLFQIEANKNWTDKPVIPFVWLRYSFNESLNNKAIKPWMAEATAIFPFFSGADGLWLWDNPEMFKTETDYSIYEYFNKGLYRLSAFKSFFEGDHTLIMETSARDYNENKQAIWRGVIKDEEILIAAHNPFAKDKNEEVNIGVSYGNWSQVINLKGYEVFLCKFDMSVLGSEKNEAFVVYPNPASERITIRLTSESENKAEFRLYANNGHLLKEFDKKAVKGANSFDIELGQIKASAFILNVQIGNQLFTKKIIKP